MRRRLITAVLAGVAIATSAEARAQSGPSAAASAPSSDVASPAYTLAVDSDDASVVSYDALATRLASELRAPVERPSAATPSRAAITITYRAETHALRVRAEHAGGRVLERSIVAQGDAASIQAEAVLLASNIARDEARELLDELSARTRPAPAPSAPAPVPEKPAPEPPEERWAGTVGVAYPIATNKGHPDVSSAVDLSIAYGRVGRVRAFQMSFGGAYASRGAAGLQLASLVLSGGPVSGVQLGIGGAVARGPISGAQLGGAVATSDLAVEGLQIATGAAFTRGHVLGSQLTAGFNYAGGGVDGAQLTAGANIATASMSGVQGSAGVNLATGDVAGVQVTAGANVAGAKVDGAQVSSVLNVASKEVTGFQVTAGVNVAADSMAGAQAAVVNIAGDVSGAQVGLVNVGRKVKGVQLGLLNIADDVDGASIGLITIAKDSIHPIAWASNLAYTNVGIKFTTKYVYTSTAIGFGTRETDFDGNPGFTMAIGGHIPLRDFDLEAELGYSSVGESSKENQALHQRVIGGYSFAKHFRVFAGGGTRTPLSFERGSSAVRPELLAGLQF